MKCLDEILTNEIHTAAIAGHVNPDGDCVGSCTAVYQYLRSYYPEIETDLYLEKPDASLLFLKGMEDAKDALDTNRHYDLFISCDASTPDRIAVAGELLSKADLTVSIDHHMSNPGFAGLNHIEAEASSCAEVLAGLMPEERIDAGIAASLYTGIIHDTGVFQYRNTTPATLRTASMLISKGIDFNKIIDESFNQRTWVQNRILGCALERSELSAGGLLVVSGIRKEDLVQFGAEVRDLSMIVSQLRLTKGVECAAFVYQTGEDTFKVSLRSCSWLDVAEICGKYGGGGHLRAAGCTIQGTYEEVRAVITEAVREALERQYEAVR